MKHEKKEKNKIHKVCCQARALIECRDQDLDLADPNLLSNYQSGTLTALDDGTIAFVPDNHPLILYTFFSDGTNCVLEYNPETRQYRPNSQSGTVVDIMVEGADPNAARVASRLDSMRNNLGPN